MKAFDELKDVLTEAGYSEQNIIDLLSRFLEENSPENIDKALVDLLDSCDSESNMS